MTFIHFLLITDNVLMWCLSRYYSRTRNRKLERQKFSAQERGKKLAVEPTSYNSYSETRASKGALHKVHKMNEKWSGEFRCWLVHR